MNPMAVKTDVDPRTMTFRDITSKVGNTFPKPVLEYNEKTQFTEEVDKQDKTLASYDWVDQKMVWRESRSSALWTCWWSGDCR